MKTASGCSDRINCYVYFAAEIVLEKERAAVKGSTFLNYCVIRRDFIDFVVDDTPYKQGMFLPGSRIPICSREKLLETRPDIVLILPWNWADEIVRQLDFVKQYGGELVTLGFV